MSKKVKIFAIVVVGFSVLIFILSKVGGSSTPSSSTESLVSSNDVSVIEGTGIDEFSTLLSSIRSINIDTSVINTPEYKSLRDYPVSLGSDIIGRTNPFAPIGSDANDPVLATTQSLVTQPVIPSYALSTPPATPSTSVIASGPQVVTLQPGKITQNSAEFGAQVTLDDTVPVSVVFQYGPTDAFGFTTAPIAVKTSGTTLVTVTNLQGKAQYKVRALMLKGTQPINGNIVEFATQ
jgi:hypothetical protein